MIVSSGVRLRRGGVNFSRKSHLDTSIGLMVGRNVRGELGRRLGIGWCVLEF